MTCTNPACLNGWIELDAEAYAELKYPIPDGASEEQATAIRQRRAQVATGMYVRPCGDCRPQQLERWANGCFAADHVARTCDLCLEAMGEKAAERHDRGGNPR